MCILPLSFFFSGSGDHRDLHSFPTRRSSDLARFRFGRPTWLGWGSSTPYTPRPTPHVVRPSHPRRAARDRAPRSEEHTSELQSRLHLVCRLLLEKKKRRESTPASESPHNVKS